MSCECAVFLRLPNGRVAPLTDEEGEVLLFANQTLAADAAETNVCVEAGWPYQVVVLDEL